MLRFRESLNKKKSKQHLLRFNDRLVCFARAVGLELIRLPLSIMVRLLSAVLLYDQFLSDVAGRNKRVFKQKLTLI